MIFIFSLFFNIFIFIILWCWQLKSRNASYVDVLWAFSLSIQALIYFVYHFNSSYDINQILPLLLVLFWSLRLSIYLFKRLYQQAEDRRYQKLRLDWQNKQQLNFFLLYQVNAIVSFLMALPFYLIFSKTSHNELALNQILIYAGFVLGFISIMMEKVADKQLANFIKHKTSMHQVFKGGLWKYSRHPNYFFEFLHWFSYGIMCLNFDYRILGFISAAIIYVFLTKVTGIPYNDLKTKQNNPQYLQYAQETNTFFPWFPRKL